MDHEIPQAGFTWRDSGACPGSYTRDMQGEGCRDTQGARIEGARTYFCFCTAAHLGKWLDEIGQGQDIEEDVDGIQIVGQGILGEAHVGTRIFCSKLRECD